MTTNLPQQLTLPLSPDVAMEFRLIPAGCFRMGSRYGQANEQPVHWVQITAPFYLGIFPVTQEQFAVWTQAEGIEHQNGFKGRAQHPAESMTWIQARDFCDWLNQHYRAHLPEGYVAGLPSEAEWEYACRAGTDTEYYTGDGPEALATGGWYAENSESSTQPVKEKSPNSFGLFEMHGNVYEWCCDEYGAYAKRRDRTCEVAWCDANTNHKGAYRVFRGGSWSVSAGWCRAAYRFGGGPGYRNRNLGFRVCLLYGPCQSEPGSAGVKSEPVPEDEARRQAEAESQGLGGDGTEVDLSEYRLPSRSDGT